MKANKTRISDIMQKSVKTISKKASLEKAVAVMHELEVSCLIIEPDNDLDAYGVITRKDVVEALLIDAQDDFNYLVEDVMSKPAITVGGNLSILNCLSMMRMAGTRRLPVLEGTKLIGIISNTDIFNTLTK